MNNTKGNKEPMDTEVVEKIELMRETPQRDPNSVAQRRAMFIAELEELPLKKSNSSFGWFTGLMKSLTSSGRENSKEEKMPKFATSTVLALIIVMIMLFGGVTATAYASQSALPGDGLYALKTRLESAQVVLESDDYSEALLHLQFAQKRMDEINALLSQGRSKDVEIATSEFENHLQDAFEDLAIVMANDPDLGAELAKQISQALLDYAVNLKTALINSPDSIKPAVEGAFLISQDGVGDELEIYGVVIEITDSVVVVEDEAFIISQLTEFKDPIGIGDFVKLHVIFSPDDNKIVREIELFDPIEDDFGNDDDMDEDDMFTENNDESEDHDSEESNDDEDHPGEDSDSDDPSEDDEDEGEEEDDSSSEDHSGKDDPDDDDDDESNGSDGEDSGSDDDESDSSNDDDSGSSDEENDESDDESDDD